MEAILIASTAVAVASSIKAGKTAEAAGKFNGTIQDRNSEIALKEAENEEQKLKWNLARFDDRFDDLQAQTRVAYNVSGVQTDRVGETPLLVLMNNAGEAELEREFMKYNSQIAVEQKEEESILYSMQADLARMEGKSAATGYYAQAGQSLLSGGSSYYSTQQGMTA